MKTYLLLMMGGSGTRLGADIPKQYIEVGGKPIFSYIVEKYDIMAELDGMVLVSNAKWIDFVEDWVEKSGVQKVIKTVAGGETRSESVLNGLTALKGHAEDDSVILIHDATHPYVDVEGTRQVIDSVIKYGGATLGACQYDTVYQMDENNFIQQVIPRREVVSGASPEAFFFKDIYDVYANSTKEEMDIMTSAGAIALAKGIDMHVIPANVLNLKITYKEDLEVFKKLVNNYFFSEEE